VPSRIAAEVLGRQANLVVTARQWPATAQQQAQMAETVDPGAKGVSRQKAIKKTARQTMFVGEAGPSWLHRSVTTVRLHRAGGPGADLVAQLGKVVAVKDSRLTGN
jgi:hypothetical protein